MNDRLFRLRCRVQHYGWGDTDFIPALLGIDNPEREPYAELWMGAHPDLPAGVLHAYLEGSGMEIMANSNNVLRGGLTPKHVDVPELLAALTFEGRSAEILRPAPIPDSREWRYETPASEFELRRLEITAGQPHENGADHSAEIVILVAAEDDARVTVNSGNRSLELRRGDVCLARFGTAYTVRAAAPATLYKATVPI